MKSYISAALGLLPSLALALPTSEPVFGCGNDRLEAPASLQASHARFAQAAKAPFPVVRRQASNTTVIPTYFHVITTSGKANSTTDATLNEQLDYMNSGYEKMGFKFDLQSVDHITNDDWANLDIQGDESTMMEMKGELRKGKYSELNIYFLSDLANGILGMCEFPTAEIDAEDPSSYSFDGCLVHGGTLPGASDFPGKFDMGGTAVHEVGHWMGLYHVFQGSSCDSDGDQISDTPFQSEATSGCPTNKDTCPDAEGVDSVNNFMDYSDDRCYTEFTPGQITRAQELFAELRQGK